MSPPNREPQIITLSLHLYHWILRFGPHEFLQEYEQIMLLDFCQQCRDVHKRWGPCGVLSLWPLLFIRAIVDMSAERIAETSKKAKQAGLSKSRENIKSPSTTEKFRTTSRPPVKLAVSAASAALAAASAIVTALATPSLSALIETTATSIGRGEIAAIIWVVLVVLVVVLVVLGVFIAIFTLRPRKKSTVGKESKIR